MITELFRIHLQRGLRFRLQGVTRRAAKCGFVAAFNSHRVLHCPALYSTHLLIFTPSVHAVVLLAESHPNSSALKVFAADACDASCRAASEVTAGVALDFIAVVSWALHLVIGAVSTLMRACRPGWKRWLQQCGR